MIMKRSPSQPRRTPANTLIVMALRVLHVLPKQGTV
jgi:hypothetical protein